MAKKKESRRRNSGDFFDSGSIFIGCMLLGLGTGLLFDLMPGALFIGMGAGFILPYILNRLGK